jgi:hypothetical protein
VQPENVNVRFDWVTREVELTALQVRADWGFFNFNKDYMRYNGVVLIPPAPYDHGNARNRVVDGDVWVKIPLNPLYISQAMPVDLLRMNAAGTALA